MGAVYEAEDAGAGRRVAVKLIRPEFADSTEAVERFRREGRLASTIQHPRCVFVLAAEEEAGRPYIVMERMPGHTLHDLVQEHGPLGIRDAVARTLDVIEGLQEAHRVGVVHRDVKPSNCFLDADGKVKVGDFGLAKSLLGPQHLTQSGAFLGTLLFASPEQIRNDHVDHRTDVYSVCATLYYLLTGKGPFQGDDNDAAATLARTVSDPLPSVRSRRGDVPATLDEVVQRGLARPRRRRWQSLDDLRLALLPFVADAHARDDVGWRVSAYLCDALLLLPLELAVQRALRLGGAGWGPAGALLLALGVSAACGLAYFGAAECLWGATPGKVLMRLRVRTAATSDRPAWWQAALRAACFYLFKDGLAVAAALALLLLGVGARPRPHESGVGYDYAVTPRLLAALAAVAVLPFASTVLGASLLALGMRRRNGYRGLHELLSRTRTIRLSAAHRRLGAQSAAWPVRSPLPAGVPARVGGFDVLAPGRVSDAEVVLYAEDGALGRPVWLWLRRDETPLPAARRAAARAGRPRWLAGGRQDGWTYDAFVAAPGASLPDLAARKRRLAWTDARDVLAALADELCEAAADGTLPAHLGAGQVWVQANGQVVLLDAAPAPGPGGHSPMDLLRQTAAVALEGRPRLAQSLRLPVRAPVPGAARAVLARLMGERQPFTAPAELRSALAEAREQPEEVARPGRALQVVVQGLALAPGLACLFLLGPLLLQIAFLWCVIGKAAVGVRQEACAQRRLAACTQVVLQRGPAGKLAAAGWLAHERRQQQDLDRLQDDLPRQQRVVLMSASWFLQRGLVPIEERFHKEYADALRASTTGTPGPDESQSLAALADDLAGGPAPLAEEALGDLGALAAALAAWPVLWCLWAGLTRGGLSFRLAGITLLGADGRPAARWRCAWRALLVWSPVFALLLAALALDLWRVAHAGQGAAPTASVRAAGWLAWAAWWAAVAVLPTYAWVAVRWPNGGPHDRLAGTYPVPR
jgi:hypothetical protein